MSIASYDVGDRVRLGNHSSNTSTGAITDLTGAAADPTAVTLTTREPDGTLTVYTHGGSPALQKETTGRYYVDVTLDAEGIWTYRLVGTGAVVLAEESVLHVRKQVTVA